MSEQEGSGLGPEALVIRTTGLASQWIQELQTLAVRAICRMNGQFRENGEWS